MGLANRVRRETPDGTIVTLEPGVTTPHGTAGAAVRIGVEGAGGFHSSFSLNCLRKWVETQEGAELFVRDVIYGFTHGWLAWKTRPWIDDVRRSVRESR